MLQAALDSRSPMTPKIKPRNKRSSQSSSEISSSPESPYGKRYCQSPSEGIVTLSCIILEEEEWVGSS